MSSGETADDAQDPEHVRFIRMRAEDTFDGQERVMSQAAYDLQVLATVHSANFGHPGYVPDDYLEDLDDLSIDRRRRQRGCAPPGPADRLGAVRMGDLERKPVPHVQVSRMSRTPFLHSERVPGVLSSR